MCVCCLLFFAPKIVPLNSKSSVTGQELVQFSRAKDLKYTAIGNDLEELVTEKLLKLGNKKGNEKGKKKC